MRIPGAGSPAAVCAATALLVILSAGIFAATVQTPKGKRIPGRILEEADNTYKVGSDLPGGGRIIFSVQKEKVDPHGTLPGKGRIEDIKGKASIKRAGMRRFVSASKYTTVNPGDEVRTERDSEVVLTLETVAVNGISENTHFALDHLEKDPETESVQVKISLPEGKLWSEVGRLRTKDSTFEIETPTAVTGVRGTVFLVEFERATAETNVSVLAGKVAVGSKDVVAPEVILDKKEALVVKPRQRPRKLSASELFTRIVDVLEEWTNKSEYFKSVTALAGIGEVEEIKIEPGLPEAQRQRIYDAIQAGWQEASEDFFQLDKALKLFYLDFARFPTVEEGGLDALVSTTGTPQWNGPYVEEEYLSDHYGVPYGYAVLRDIYGNEYVQITTFGYDKKPGTTDDRQKIIREEDARRWEDSRSYR